jgi:ornithine cyclodeaminase
VRAALILEHTGTARTLAKTAVAWGSGHTLHALGGVAEGLGLVGTKTWAHTRGGANPLVVLWDEQTGQLRAVIEAFALGQLRTASVSAVAIATLAVADASVLAIVGSGKQAVAQVAAAVGQRPITDVRVFSPTPAHREACAEQLRAILAGRDVVACDSVAGAVAGADIVTTVTRATEPFLEPAMLVQHALVNALGAITPERAEVTVELVAGSSLIVSDSPSAAAELSSELRGVPAVVALSEIVAAPLRTAGDGRAGHRLFKAMGLGLADVAVAAEVWRRCRERQRGTVIPPRSAAAPLLFTAHPPPTSRARG